MLIVSTLQNLPLFIANEALRGLPQWQAVLREGSAVPCTTESWVPRRGGGVTSVARSKKICIINTPHFVWKRVRRPKGKATPS